MSQAPESPDHEDALDSCAPLDDDELARLDAHLTSAAFSDEAPDVISAHGFLTALAVAPADIPSSRWLAELFEGEPAFVEGKLPLANAEREDLLTLLSRLKDNAASLLERGHAIELPFDTDEHDADGDTAAAIEDWCAGFMQGVFLDEAAWFDQDESHVAALLLPYMALSGLFEDEPEMTDMVAEDHQFLELASQLRELTLDLYLHFRVPPEPAQKTPARSQSRTRRGKPRR